MELRCYHSEETTSTASQLQTGKTTLAGTSPSLPPSLPPLLLPPPSSTHSSPFSLASPTTCDIPFRLLSAYFHSAATLNYTRAALAGGFANIRQAALWNFDFVKDAELQKEYHTIVGNIFNSLDVCLSVPLSSISISPSPPFSVKQRVKDTKSSYMTSLVSFLLYLFPHSLSPPSPSSSPLLFLSTPLIL